MGSVGFKTFSPKRTDINTVFVVENITNGTSRAKTVKLFSYPIPPGKSRDLLTIPYVSEADIRHALLKGNLRIKLEAGEIRVVDSNIDLLQFDSTQRAFLQSVGITNGLDAGGSGSFDDDQHARIRQLIHLADATGPMESFSGAFREILPEGDPFPTDVIWWENSSKLKKIIEKTLIYDGDLRVTEIIWKLYDTGGSLLTTMTDTIEYVGASAFESTRTRTLVDA